ncbi:MAG: 50S ribosomal protein L4 [Candidatus Bathyarchaeia archaeon]
MTAHPSEQTQTTPDPTHTVPVYTLEGKPNKKLTLPPIFQTPIRPDLIKRAVLAVQSTRLQPKGRDPRAGKKSSAVSRGVGLGIARVPRIKGQGYPKAGQAAMIHSAVGGRLAHPPKTAKIILKRINKKERHLAIRSAIAATANTDAATKRGHRLGTIDTLPLIVEDEIERVKTTNAICKAIESLGLADELERLRESSTRIRAGRGKTRGRKYRNPCGPLIVVASDQGISKAASNIPGVETALVDRLNAELLAPGAHPGRLTIWSESAIKRLEEENIFN